MGRAPCCEKMGLKKGPWTPEEDLILVSYIRRYGHGNWRALPKQAGLLRCGKSCRLRWTNYLRPDVKRGEFSKEEEEIIIHLHALLGNRWSAIAAKLPGRTDNEIKNMWHTHLKKRLNPNQTYKESKRRSRGYAKCKKEPSKTEVQGHKPPPVCSHSDASSTADARKNCVLGTTNSLEWLPKIDDALWSGGQMGNKDSNLVEQEASISKKFDSWSSSGEDVMSFWINMLAEAGNLA